MLKLDQLKIFVKDCKSKIKSFDGIAPDDRFEDLPTTNLAIDDEICFIQSKLDVTNVCGGVREDYQLKESMLSLLRDDIVGLDEKRDNLFKDLDNETGRISKLITDFIEPVNIRFMRMFQRFKFNGRIEWKLEDGKWILLILVSFREDEPLTPLSAQRQSGGEKSLATVVFLLALQQSTIVPFRLVDEINQGMDAVNERVVFELLREMSSQTQFFIITPKLVDGLVFSENTTAIVLYGGPGITKDLEKYVNSLLLE